MLKDANIVQDEAGRWNCGGDIGVTVDTGGRLFKRRAMKPFATGGTQEKCLLVAELDGVRTYIDTRGDAVHVVVTKGDIYPGFGDVPTATA